MRQTLAFRIVHGMRTGLRYRVYLSYFNRRTDNRIDPVVYCSSRVFRGEDGSGILDDSIEMSVAV